MLISLLYRMTNVGDEDEKVGSKMKVASKGWQEHNVGGVEDDRC